MHDAVLFDLDGTLLDTPDGIARTLHAVIGEAGHEVADSEVRATIGRPLAESLAGLLRRDVADPEVREAVTRYRKLFDEWVVPVAAELVYPGVPELLARLRDRGLRLGVVTSKSKAGADELLGAADLLGTVDVVIGSDLTERGKPAPDPALLAARTLGVSAESCVVVGDAVVDIRMASAAGMRACGVAHGVGTVEELLAASATSVARTVAELSEHLGLSAHES